MTRHRPHLRTRPTCPQGSRAVAGRGFTLVEAVMCTLLVGVILVAAISTLGAARRSRQGVSDRALARVLAGDLLTEITTRAYAEPGGTSSFGPDAGEQAQSRTTLDDVDDYHNLDETPPRDAAANPIKGCEKWSRTVRVEHVNADKPDEVSFLDSGLKRITVTILANGEVLAQRSAIRTKAADAGRL